MNQNYTHASILLDRSLSMSAIKEEVISGYNSFVESQKALPGEMSISLAQFDHEYESVYKMADLKNIHLLTKETFVPRGNTALLDSAAQLINETGYELAELPEDKRPSKVMFVMITDGAENSSVRQTKKSIAEMIRHQKEKYNWEFVYLGANQDSFTEAHSMGMRGHNFMADAAGIGRMVGSLSRGTKLYRSGEAASLDLTDLDENQ